MRLYHEVEQVGTPGRSVAVTDRRAVVDDWPEHLIAVGATISILTSQGPLG